MKKITLAALILFVLDGAPLFGFDKLVVEEAAQMNNGGESDKDLKIIHLNDLLDQMQRDYEKKIAYLQAELRKSQNSTLSQAMNNRKMQNHFENVISDMDKLCKRELIGKTKTIMEYQRMLEKNPPSEEAKKLIQEQAEIAIQNRSRADQMAVARLRETQRGYFEDAAVMHLRQPASVNEK